MWFSAYSGFSVSKNQNWVCMLKWKLVCFPLFWVGLSFVCLWSTRLGKCSCSTVSVWVEPSVQLQLQFPDEEHTTAEEGDLLGKQVVENPDIQGKRLWTWNLLEEDSRTQGLRRLCGKSYKGGSWLWCTRGLSGHGQQKKLQSTYCLAGSWEGVERVRVSTGRESFPLI